MRAILVDSHTTSKLRLGDAPDPVVRPGQILVAHRASSINFGELNRARSGGSPDGHVPGWDAAGIVEQADPAGGGPAVGTAVLTRGSDGGWAQRRAIAVDEVAVIPEGVDMATAAALPVAAGSALRALRVAGPLLGRTVVVTSAAGGVGRFAVELAARGGARVIAQVGSTERAQGLAEVGATETVIHVDEISVPVDVVIDNVGGPLMLALWSQLAPGGIIVSVGWTSGQPVTLPPYATVGGDRTIHGFSLGAQLGEDLELLLGMVARDQLHVEIGWRDSWEKVDDAAAALLGRQVRGKAVIEIS